jgi:hypothetical protein
MSLASENDAFRDQAALQFAMFVLSNDGSSLDQVVELLGTTKEKYKPEVDYPRFVAKQAFIYADALAAERLSRITNSRGGRMEQLKEMIKAGTLSMGVDKADPGSDMTVVACVPKYPCKTEVEKLWGSSGKNEGGP